VIDAGDGTDIVEGGLGSDTISLGSQSPGDGDADIVVFDENVMNGERELPEFSFDVIHDFEEGDTGEDVVHIVKPGNAFDGSTDMPEINSGQELANLLPEDEVEDEIDILEFTTDFGTINLNATTTADQDQIEDNFLQMLATKATSNVASNANEDAIDELAEYLETQLEGIFALAYDNSNDPANTNAGLFFIESDGPGGEVNFNDVRLVAVFSDVGANNMEANDFKIFSDNDLMAIG
jgi:hypothetical protein